MGFGWDYPAGVSDKDIDEMYGTDEDPERNGDAMREDGENDYEREEDSGR